MTERHEKIRQAIMRYRELLDLLRIRQEVDERAYAALFDGVDTEAKASLQEKALQGEAARLALDDLEPLRRAVLSMQLGMRDFAREFEELYGNIALDESDEAD
ncbi:MAG: hypothetical protein SF123_24395 [Chloroflexota bacterium]|nr:hypothetical protein [Chloroflexota bacterium]